MNQPPPDDPLCGPTLPAADAAMTGPFVGPAFAEGPPPARAGRCELLGEIARGGMGAVFEARDPDLDRRLAVKVLLEQHRDHADLVRRFLAEARVCARLQHPGVVPVHEVGRLPDGRPFFTMKLIQGRTLADLLGERASPADNLPRFLHVFEQLCQTVAYAHSRGVLHRDLKPSNVMVGAFGEVQVMDWGLAKVLASGGCKPPDDSAGHCTPHPGADAPGSPAAACDDAALSRAGAMLGTPAYMAPEQAAGATDVIDRRADVFGLGAVLCEVLTGEPPYRGRGGMELLQAASADLTDAFARLDGCGADPELVRLAKDCLAADPAARPADAGAVAARVTAYLAGVQARLKAAELEKAAAQARAAEERKRRRLNLALAGAGAALLLAAAGAALWYYQDRAARAAEDDLRRAAAAEKQAAAERAADTALAEATRSQREGRYAEALAATRLAEGLLDNADLSERLADVREREADLKVLAALDEVPLRIMLLGERSGGAIDLGRAAGLYAEAFRAYGLDVPALEADEAVRRLGGKAVRAELTAALQDWARATPDSAEKRRLTAVVRGAAESRGAPLPDLPPHAQAAHAEAAFLVGEAWRQRKDYAAAADACQQALRLEPDDPRFHHALGAAREGQRAWALAALAYQDAVRLRPDDAPLRNDLARALRRKGDAAAAAAADQAAVGLEPENAYFYYCLGLSLEEAGDQGGACGAYQRAVHFKPEDFEYLCTWGRALRRAGRFAEEAAALKQNQGWDLPGPSVYIRYRRELRAAERLAQFDALAPALLHGEAEPADAALRCEAAEVFSRRGRPAAAAQWYADAFADAPDLAEDLPSGRRYDAACAAARAGCGRDDGGRLDPEARPRWRGQAVAWLRGDLDAWGRQLDGGEGQDRDAAGDALWRWTADPDLAGLRDPEVLGRLPEAERDACRRLWADVEVLRRRADAAP
jgi:serine/threonine-protein kinase